MYVCHSIFAIKMIYNMFALPCCREQQCQKRIAELTKQINTLKRQKEEEVNVITSLTDYDHHHHQMHYIIQALDEQTAYLKDQLQELKARTGLETKYIKKQTQVSTWYVSTQPTSGSSAISCLEPCAVQPAAASAQ